MPVKIHNKDYWTVAERIAKSHEDNKKAGIELGIETQLISHDTEKIIMKALIMNGEILIATGYAEEFRDSSKINQTSALENAETSAVGRALAFFGLAGTEIASADEVAAAITQQREKELYAAFQETTQANEANHDALLAIRGFLAKENWSAAKKAWSGVLKIDQRPIWVSAAKGGWFTEAERKQMKAWPDDT